MTLLETPRPWEWQALSDERGKFLRVLPDGLHDAPEQTSELQGAVELRPVRVATVLRELQAAFTPERDITIGLDVDETLHVAADEALLRRAVSALLHNAINFSIDGARILLRCRADEQGVAIEVEDECGGLGPGSPAEIFKSAVHRADGVEHLGRGLRLARRAVEAMGGDIHVEDHPDFGCTFALLFPSVRSGLSSVPPAASVKEPRQGVEATCEPTRRGAP
jgi:signal transduction histidine kinase